MVAVFTDYSKERLMEPKPAWEGCTYMLLCAYCDSQPRVQCLWVPQFSRVIQLLGSSFNSTNWQPSEESAWVIQTCLYVKKYRDFYILAKSIDFTGYFAQCTQSDLSTDQFVLLSVDEKLTSVVEMKGWLSCACQASGSHFHSQQQKLELSTSDHRVCIWI